MVHSYKILYGTLHNQFVMFWCCIICQILNYLSRIRVIVQNAIRKTTVLVLVYTLKAYEIDLGNMVFILCTSFQLLMYSVALCSALINTSKCLFTCLNCCNFCSFFNIWRLFDNIRRCCLCFN